MIPSFLILLTPLAIVTSSYAAAIGSRGFTKAYRANSTNPTLANGVDQTIYGVNLGSWFVFEPYMAQSEWDQMGGNGICDEFGLTQKLGQAAANKAFAQHWASWITQSDVDLMKQYGLNSVRIPIGFWIIEETVNPSEHYPQGGLDYLRKGCKMFNDAGISVLLDMHAAPGAQTAHNAFAGHCVTAPQFWEQSNFDRMTHAVRKLVNYVHSDPDNFGSVYGIEALNEPPTDGSQTPGYPTYLQQFVTTIRDEETSLNVAGANALSTAFMNAGWQWKNSKVNPADVINGPSIFDSHLYYSFGAPSGPDGTKVTTNQASHIKFACSGGGGRINVEMSSKRNKPLVLGEWWLGAMSGTASNTDKAFYQKFGDAQKMPYALHAGGWYFWSWKMNPGQNDSLRSYKDAVAQGYLTKDAASYFNKNTCN